MRRLIITLAVVPLLGALAIGAETLRPTTMPGSEVVPASALMFNTNHDCSFCHGVHGGSPDRLLQDPVVETLCLSCHGPGGPSSLKADVHTNDTQNSCCPPFRVTCNECHDPHSNQTNWLGGTNLKLVLDTVIAPRNNVKRPVVFESRGDDVGEPTLHSFCDQDEDANGIWDGVCDTCHDPDVGRHKYTDPGNHNHQRGNTCTRCHEHQQTFNP